MIATTAHMTRSMVVASAMAAAACTSAAALDADAMQAEIGNLGADTQPELMRAATALCLAEIGNRMQIVSTLRSAGWSVGGTDDWIEADRGNSWVTLMGDDTDYFCDVQGDVSQSDSVQMLWDLFKNTRYAGWEITETDRACNLFTHTSGAGIYISSAGNDPTCEPDPSSGIRVHGP